MNYVSAIIFSLIISTVGILLALKSLFPKYYAGLLGENKLDGPYSDLRQMGNFTPPFIDLLHTANFRGVEIEEKAKLEFMPGIDASKINVVQFFTLFRVLDNRLRRKYFRWSFRRTPLNEVPYFQLMKELVDFYINKFQERDHDSLKTIKILSIKWSRIMEQRMRKKMRFSFRLFLLSLAKFLKTLSFNNISHILNEYILREKDFYREIRALMKKIDLKSKEKTILNSVHLAMHDENRPQVFNEFDKVKPGSGLFLEAECSKSSHKKISLWYGKIRITKFKNAEMYQLIDSIAHSDDHSNPSVEAWHLVSFIEIVGKATRSQKSEKDTFVKPTVRQYAQGLSRTIAIRPFYSTLQQDLEKYLKNMKI